MRRLNLPPLNNNLLRIFSDSGPGLGGGRGIDGPAASGDGGSDGPGPGPNGCAVRYTPKTFGPVDCPESDGLVGGPGSGGCAPVDSTKSDGEYGFVGGPGSDLGGSSRSNGEFCHGDGSDQCEDTG
jgi:hypothetical protein